jgi:lipoprotein-releasing system ATP-binding protein
LHILGTIEKPSAGRVRFGGLDPFGLSRKALARFRNLKVGFVFQLHYLLPEFSTLENVMIPAMIRGETDKVVRKKALNLLEEVGLEKRAMHRPGELSGGEAQRVAIARALINDPDIVLADEPTGSLDEETGMRAFQLLMEIRREKGMTLVVVTHNDVFWGLMDRCLKLRQGRIREEV